MKRQSRSVPVIERGHVRKRRIVSRSTLYTELDAATLLVAMSNLAAIDAEVQGDKIGAIIHRKSALVARRKVLALQEAIKRAPYEPSPDEAEQPNASPLRTSLSRKTVHERLMNWGRWARVGPNQEISTTGIICEAMAEWHREIDDGAPPPAEPDPIDEADAVLIEHVMRRVPIAYRDFFKLQYVQGHSRAALIRKCGIRPKPASVFDLFVARARRKLEEILDIAENGPTIRPDNPIPAAMQSEATRAELSLRKLEDVD